MHTTVGEVPDQYVVHDIGEDAFKTKYPKEYFDLVKNCTAAFVNKADVTKRLFLDNGCIAMQSDNVKKGIPNGYNHQGKMTEYIPLYRSKKDPVLIGYCDCM